MQRYSELQSIVKAYSDYKAVLSGIDSAKDALSDPELEEMAREELETLEVQRETLEGRLETLLLPKDPFDDKMSSSRFAPRRVATRRRCLPLKS